MYFLPGLLGGSGSTRASVDAYMERARALKHETQIYPREVKHLILKLEHGLQLARGARGKSRLPGSRYSPAEVYERVAALRSLLLAMEVVKRTREDAAVPATLREHARTQLLRAIIAL